MFESFPDELIKKVKLLQFNKLWQTLFNVLKASVDDLTVLNSFILDTIADSLVPNTQDSVSS